MKTLKAIACTAYAMYAIYYLYESYLVSTHEDEIAEVIKNHDFSDLLNGVDKITDSASDICHGFAKMGVGIHESIAARNELRDELYKVIHKDDIIHRSMDMIYSSLRKELKMVKTTISKSN
jgi:hypothetical protein